MIHIVLCCAAAMSTSLLVEKMKREADYQGIRVDIRAVGVHDVHQAYRCQYHFISSTSEIY